MATSVQPVIRQYIPFRYDQVSYCPPDADQEAEFRQLHLSPGLCCLVFEVQAKS